jgi:hypothetical protein
MPSQQMQLSICWCRESLEPSSALSFWAISSSDIRLASGALIFIRHV